MPSDYAHYRFGAAMLSAMPADLRRPANRFRQMYDMGLHGPDIFTYSPPGIPKVLYDENNERLKVLTESNDGFYITEKDYDMRGEGDLFGVKQSGDMEFKIKGNIPIYPPINL